MVPPPGADGGDHALEVVLLPDARPGGLEPAEQGVRVSVAEPGDQGPALEIDRLDPLATREGQGSLAEGDDPPVLEGRRLGGDDPPVPRGLDDHRAAGEHRESHLRSLSGRDAGRVLRRRRSGLAATDNEHCSLF